MAGYFLATVRLIQPCTGAFLTRTSGSRGAVKTRGWLVLRAASSLHGPHHAKTTAGRRKHLASVPLRRHGAIGRHRDSIPGVRHPAQRGRDGRTLSRCWERQPGSRWSCLGLPGPAAPLVGSASAIISKIGLLDVGVSRPPTTISFHAAARWDRSVCVTRDSLSSWRCSPLNTTIRRPVG